MLSDSSGCCVGRDLQGAAETTVKKPVSRARMMMSWTEVGAVVMSFRDI